jgi:ParB family chromosome partitioning protein
MSMAEAPAAEASPDAPPAAIAETPVPAKTTPVIPVMRTIPAPLAKSGVTELALDRIVPNPHQPRRQMNEAALAELAASLKTTGLIQPIIVRQAGDQFELIAGERRLRAAKIAGLDRVPAIIRDASAFEQAQMALIENIQRENLNPIDRAVAYRALMNQLGLTQAELAGRMGEDRSSIANFLRLLELAPVVQGMVADGRLSLGHAKILAGLDDPSEQERLAQIVVNQALSVRNLERQIKPGAAPSITKNNGGVSPHLAGLEKSLSRQLGLRVQLKSGQKKDRGRVTIHYGNLDQFDDLMTRLGVKADAE